MSEITMQKDDIVYQCPICARIESEIKMSAASYDFKCLGREPITDCTK